MMRFWTKARLARLGVHQFQTDQEGFDLIYKARITIIDCRRVRFLVREALNKLSPPHPDDRNLSGQEKALQAVLSAFNGDFSDLERMANERKSGD